MRLLVTFHSVLFTLVGRLLITCHSSLVTIFPPTFHFSLFTLHYFSYGKSSRSAAARAVRQEHAKDHARHEDGRRGEAAPRPGARTRRPALFRDHHAHAGTARGARPRLSS